MENSKKKQRNTIKIPPKINKSPRKTRSITKDVGTKPKIRRMPKQKELNEISTGTESLLVIDSSLPEKATSSELVPPANSNVANISKSIITDFNDDGSMSESSNKQPKNGRKPKNSSMTPNEYETTLEHESQEIRHDLMPLANDNDVNSNSKRDDLSDDEVDDKDDLSDHEHNDDPNSIDEFVGDSQTDRRENQQTSDIEIQPDQRDLKDDSQETKNSEKYREKYLLLKAWKKEVSKDVEMLTKEVGGMKEELKGIKRQLKKEKQELAPQQSSDEEENDFHLLPNLPINKKKEVREMEKNILSNDDYVRQIIARLYPLGGGTIKKNIINIFEELFTPRLRSKICWSGSTKGPGKMAFHPFKGIRTIIRRSVRRDLKCTQELADIEIKLRFKQGDKDYDREKQKRNLL